MTPFGQRDMRLRMIEPVYDVEFEFATDEGPAHGGDQTAPPLLAYFCTGLVTCLMTQLRAFSKRLRVDIRGVKVTLARRCHFKCVAHVAIALAHGAWKISSN